MYSLPLHVPLTFFQSFLLKSSITQAGSISPSGNGKCTGTCIVTGTSCLVRGIATGGGINNKYTIRINRLVFTSIPHPCLKFPFRLKPPHAIFQATTLFQTEKECIHAPYTRAHASRAALGASTRVDWPLSTRWGRKWH